jgi:hypothetical protein
MLGFTVNNPVTHKPAHHPALEYSHCDVGNHLHALFARSSRPLAHLELLSGRQLSRRDSAQASAHFTVVLLVRQPVRPTEEITARDCLQQIKSLILITARRKVNLVTANTLTFGNRLNAARTLFQLSEPKFDVFFQLGANVRAPCDQEMGVIWIAQMHLHRHIVAKPVSPAELHRVKHAKNKPKIKNAFY